MFDTPAISLYKQTILTAKITDGNRGQRVPLLFSARMPSALVLNAGKVSLTTFEIDAGISSCFTARQEKRFEVH